MRESKVEEHLVAVVERLGGEVRKVQWIGRRGAPDRLCLVAGVGEIWVELKRPGKDAEEHQHREHERMRRLGCHVVVLNSIELIDEFFKRFFQGSK